MMCLLSHSSSAPGYAAALCRSVTGPVDRVGSQLHSFCTLPRRASDGSRALRLPLPFLSIVESPFTESHRPAVLLHCTALLP